MAQRQNTPRPGDFTGSQKAKLAKEHAEEVKKREGEIAMFNAAEQEAVENRVTDYTRGPNSPVILDDEKSLADAAAELEATRSRLLDQPGETVLLDTDAVNVRESFRTIRINDDLEDVTIGAGNNYTFRAGEKYKVPVHVADHLEEKGYVWH